MNKLRYTIRSMFLIYLLLILICLDVNLIYAPEGNDVWGDTKPTAENLMQIQEPTTDLFNGLSSEEKEKYVSNPDNLDNCIECFNEFYKKPENVGLNPKADDAYFSRDESLYNSPESANIYLRDKFSSPNVNFEIVEGMRYSEESGLCVGGNCIVVDKKSVNSIPSWAESVGYNEGEFIFSPRLNVKGDVLLKDDGTFVFKKGVEIFDKQTGETIILDEDVLVKYNDNGIEVIGSAKGNWVDAFGYHNSYVNIDGRFVMNDKAIGASSSSNLEIQNKRISGSFSLGFGNRGQINSVNLGRESTLDDFYGSLKVGEKGYANINFNSDGSWSSVRAKDSELSYGSFKSNTKTQQHYFNGDFEMNVYPETLDPMNAKILSPDSYYKDRINDVRVYHDSEKSNIYFGEFLYSDFEKMQRKLGSTSSFAMIGESGRMFGNGKIGIETSTFDYLGSQNRATLNRAIKDNDETIIIDGENEGEIARFSKKSKVVRLLRGNIYRKEDVSIDSVIVKEDGKLRMDINEEQLRNIASDSRNIIFSEKNLKVLLGDNDASLYVDKEMGMIYSSLGSKPLVFFSPNKVVDSIGNKFIDIENEINSLNNQISAGGSQNNIQELVKKRDSLKFLVHEDDMIQKVAVGDFQGAIDDTQLFLEQNSNSPIADNVRMSLAEMHQRYAASINVKEGSEGIVTLGGERYPLSYKTKFIDGKEVVVAWSPDGKNWMDLDETEVSVGEFAGSSVREENLVILEELNLNNGDISVLNDAALNRGISLSGQHAKPHESYLRSIEEYQNAINFYESVRSNPELAEDAAMNLGGVYSQLGDTDRAYEEYEFLTHSEDVSVKSKGYLGIGITNAQEGNLEESLYQVSRALELDPDNKVARATQLQLEYGVLRAVDNGLSAESRQTLSAYLTKVGMDDYEGGGWDNIKQVFGNTGRIIAGQGYANNLLLVQEGVQQRLSSEQAGVAMLMMANRGGYTLEQMSNMEDDDRRNLISDMIGTDDYERVTFFNAGLGHALANHDVTLASQHGKMTQQQLIEALKNPGAANALDSTFKFRTGGGYVNNEALEYNWRDMVFEGADLKNVAMIALPMAKVGQGITWSAGLVRGAQAVKIAEAQTAAGALLGGVIKGGQSLIGAERSAALANWGANLQSTVGASRIGQFLAQEYSTGIGFVDKSISVIGSMGIGEIGEEGVGYFGGKVVGFVNPAWEAPTNMILSMGAGHAQLFDGTIEGLQRAAKTSLNNVDATKRIIFGSGGEVLGEGVGFFGSKQARDQFVDNLRRNVKGFEDLGDGAFSVNGKTFYAGIKGEGLPVVSGQQAVGAIDINPNAVADKIAKDFQAAKVQMFEGLPQRPREVNTDVEFVQTSRPVSGAVTDTPLVGTKDVVVEQARRTVSQVDESAGFGAKRLDNIDRSIPQGHKVTAVNVETNGYRVNGDVVTDSNGKVLNELQHANSYGHGEFGNRVIEHNLKNYDEAVGEAVRRYNINHPDNPIKKLDDYARVGPRGGSLFIQGDVDSKEFKTILAKTLEEKRKTFLSGLPQEVSSGEVTGFRVGMGSSETGSAKEAYNRASLGMGGGTLKNGETFGAKHTTSIVENSDIDTSDTMYFEYSRQIDGIDTPDSNGVTLRTKYESAEEAFSLNPTEVNRQNLEEIVNEIRYRANTNSVTGAVNTNVGEELVRAGKVDRISTGGEENFILYKASDGSVQKIFSDVDGFGNMNRELNLELAQKVKNGEYSLEDIVVGAKADERLMDMQRITQDVLDNVEEVNAQTIDTIRRSVAETGSTRSYAMYNGADDTLPGIKADSNVKQLVEEGSLNGVDIDMYNEMVIAAAKDNGKNGVAVLESLDSTGTSGKIRLINDDSPEGILYDVDFDTSTGRTITRLSENIPQRKTLDQIVEDIEVGNEPDVSNMVELGRGRDGVVFDAGEGKVLKYMPNKADFARSEFVRLRELNELGVSQAPYVSGNVNEFGLPAYLKSPNSPDGYLISEKVEGMTVSDFLGEDIGGALRPLEFEGHQVVVRDMLEEKYRVLAKNGYSFDDKWNLENVMITMKGNEPDIVVIDVGGLKKTDNINWDGDYGTFLNNFEEEVSDRVRMRKASFRSAALAGE